MIYDIFSNKTKAYRYDKSFSKELDRLDFELKNTYNCFNEATDPMITEALIYRMKELELQYSFLMKRAKTERLCGKLLPSGISK